MAAQLRPPHILVVEDDPALGPLLGQVLEEHGYQVTLCQRGEEGLEKVATGTFDLCVLDIMLPGMDGLEVGQHIREMTKAVPIIYLTARSLKADKRKAFAHGADDYITKPFDEEELLWRIEAVLRRSHPTEAIQHLTSFEHYSLSIDFERQFLRIGDQHRQLTQKETQILQLLCAHPDQVLPRETLLLHIWGKNDYFLGRSLDVFITKLRKYLKPEPTVKIVNIFRVGFMWVVEEKG